MKHYDAIVIGSGITGSCTARELAKYVLKTAVLEKGSDFCAGASRDNSATIHSGHDAKAGSLKAYYNVRGNAMYDQLCEELDVKLLRNGYIVFATSDEQMKELEGLVENGKRNGVPGVRMCSREELAELEGAEWGEDVLGGLYAPTGAQICPYTFVFAMCENAYANGVEFYRNTGVTDIRKTEEGFLIKTDNPEEPEFTAKYIFNCAGCYADEMNNFVSDNKIKIIPRKGTHFILDKKLAPYAKATISEAPHDLPGGGHTKGMCLMPSLDGTVILGCESVTIEDKSDTSSNQEGIDSVKDFFKSVWPSLPIAKYYPQFPENMIITHFAGNRPHPEGDDFIVGEVADATGFFNEAGIESPGLTAGPAIAADVVGRAAEKYGFEVNTEFNPIRKATKPFREMTLEEKAEAIKKDPDYGQIICRCEQVTKAEVLDAVRRPLGATSLMGVKMRVRAGMGRCQGGFCSPEVVRILSDELHIPMTEVLHAGAGSEVLKDET